MQAKKRYVLVLLCCAFLALCCFGGCRLKGGGRLRAASGTSIEALECYVDDEELAGNQHRPRALPTLLGTEFCRMDNCFELERCRAGFKVYVYPVSEEEQLSPTYRKILDSLLESGYYEPDPKAACLFVLALDTLDRDVLSTDYNRDLQRKLHRLPHWNGGRNHIIFNSYSGTWPDYAEDLGLDIGRAILAKASMSTQRYRPNFDVSLPLVHKEHPQKGNADAAGAAPAPTTKTYLLAFKGKRYVYGIGSETRNSLYHLHNGRDIIMVTTCKHGKSWKDLKDERCEEDNAEYDR